MPCTRELEQELASFLGRKHCIVFTTGYQANLGMMSGLAGPKDTIYLDADSHSSIYDGCTLSGAKLVRFRHNDATDLDKRLARGGRRGRPAGGARRHLFDAGRPRAACRFRRGQEASTASSFSSTRRIPSACSGPMAAGLADEAGLEDEVDFVVGTFSKSVGAIGGFGAGNHPLVRNAALCDAALHVHGLVVAGDHCDIARGDAQACRGAANGGSGCSRNSARLFEGFKALGLEMGCDQVSPVIAVKCADELSTIAMWNALLEAGVYVNIALPPGTPARLCLLRCSVSAAHSIDDIDRIIELFGKVVAHGAPRLAAAS